MSKRFPDRLDPWRFADLNNQISGRLPFEAFSRLRECLMEADGEVLFDLDFSRDERRYARLDGHIQAELALECQRCLGTLKFPVDREFSVVFVQGLNEAERLPDNLEPCLVEEGVVDFRELVEDELLLALPQVPMHDTDVCQLPREFALDEADLETESDKQDNPFAVLSGLKSEEH
ncbi:MAG: YceD family protein [Candidatus Thiodiazotropha sp. LLP2]